MSNDALPTLHLVVEPMYYSVSTVREGECLLREISPSVVQFFLRDDELSRILLVLQARAVLKTHWQEHPEEQESYNFYRIFLKDYTGTYAYGPLYTQVLDRTLHIIDKTMTESVTQASDLLLFTQPIELIKHYVTGEEYSVTLTTGAIPAEIASTCAYSQDVWFEIRLIDGYFTPHDEAAGWRSCWCCYCMVLRNELDTGQ